LIQASIPGEIPMILDHICKATPLARSRIHGPPTS
jgi:hypothetical protein